MSKLRNERSAPSLIDWEGARRLRGPGNGVLKSWAIYRYQSQDRPFYLGVISRELRGRPFEGDQAASFGKP
jgi:hypothetical protein